MYILKKYFVAYFFSLTRSKKLLLQITFDCFLISFAFLLALILRLETLDYFYHFDTYIGVLIAIIVTISIFLVKGLYNNLTRHISIETIFSMVMCSLVSCIFLFFFTLLLDLAIPLSGSLIFGILLCFFTIGVRLFIRNLGENVNKKKLENVAIYGAGAAGIQLMDVLRKNPNYLVRLFIDDDLELDGKKISMVPITNSKNIKNKLQKLEIQSLFLAIPSKASTIHKRVIDMISDYPIRVKTVPSLSNLIDGNFKINQLKDIKIDDLLGREPVKPNSKLMTKSITKKTVLVTGAGGSIGSELCRQIIHWKPKRLILIDVSEFAIYNLLEELKVHPLANQVELIPLIGSVLDNNFIRNTLNCFVVDIIYHAAAYKHVPLMEQNVMQCISNNVFGTLNMAEASIDAKVKDFILVSTDKAVNPTSFMGVSKRLAEIICQTLSTENKDTCFSIVRFGNVLGSSGSVVPLFKKQIEEGGPITLTHIDITRYFMTITEAAQLVIQAGSIAKGGDVFVLDMGKSIKILDLAKQMVNLSGNKPILNSTETSKDGEIAITVLGLRPGEKLYEELTYNSNLIGTIHPRINTAVEKPMKSENFYKIISLIRNAIRDNDYQNLFQNIAKITNGVFDTSKSTDILFKSEFIRKNKVIPIQHNNGILKN